MRICVMAALMVVAMPFGARAQSSVHPFVGAPEDQAVIDEVLDGFFASGPPAQTIYVAPPDGSSTGSGTVEDPRRDLIAVVAAATAGTAIYLAPGVYSMSAIRDAFGHPSSVLRTRSSGVRGAPIILSTDPEQYDPDAGRVAILDFEYDNRQDGVRTMSIDLGHDFWLIERLEIRHMDGRGIWLSGYDNVIRDNYLHHVDTAGTNNEALIMVSASGRPTNNVIMGNHLSHVGVLDRATGALTDPGGVNVGCIYTETRQSYDSDLPDPASSPTLQDYLDALLPADGHIYIYNNYAHHCAYAYGTKNASEGPYFFLSNVAHDVRIGVRNVFSQSVIRNNIFFPGAGDVVLDAGVSNGASAGRFWGEIFNGHRSEISHNTIVGARDGLSLRSGWSVRAHDNLVVRTDDALHVQRNQYDWYEGGAWPGIRGEWLLGDLGPAHPYYAQMPRYLQDMEGTFVAYRAENNCYDAEPAIGAVDFVQPDNDVTGMIADEDYLLVPEGEVAGLFLDEETYVRDRSDATYAHCGSRVTSGGAPPPPLPDGGMPPGSPDGGPSPTGDGGIAQPDGGTAPAPSGCGCRAAGTGAPPIPFVLAALALLRIRRRARAA